MYSHWQCSQSGPVSKPHRIPTICHFSNIFSTLLRIVFHPRMEFGRIASKHRPKFGQNIRTDCEHYRPLSVRSLGRKNHLASNLCGFVFLGGFRYYSGRFYRIFNNDKHIECANLFELVYWTRSDQPTFSELPYFIAVRRQSLKLTLPIFFIRTMQMK